MHRPHVIYIIHFGLLLINFHLLTLRNATGDIILHFKSNNKNNKREKNYIQKNIKKMYLIEH